MKLLSAAFVLAAAAGLSGLAGCKPPPTDEALLREAPQPDRTFASEPLPSPEAEGAMWARSSRGPDRIVYGIPGQPALLALSCDRSAGILTVTRISPADKDAGAMLALIGNGHVGRLPVDATGIGEDILWQGSADAQSEQWEPLAGPRKLTATIPGAGMVEINPSQLPMRLIESCRAES